MRVLYFGSYDPEYPRTRVIIKGLRENGVEVEQCSDFSKILPRYLKLVKKYRHDYDVLFVGTYRWQDVPLAKILTSLSRKPLVFDSLASLYEKRLDRKFVKAYFYLNKLIFNLSDFVLTGTNRHIKFFRETFGVKKRKFIRVFPGSDDSVFYPRKMKRDGDAFVVTLHGMHFRTFHGPEYIGMAAKQLEDHKDIRFKVLGPRTGIKIFREFGVKNFTFREYVPNLREPAPYEKLSDFVARGDACLGIFGNTQIGKMEVPHKVFEILAMEKPLITGDTPAVREAGIVNRKNALLVELANSKALAEGILELKENKKLRNKIAKNGYKLFKENFTPKAIGADLKKTLEEITGRK